MIKLKINPNPKNTIELLFGLDKREHKDITLIFNLNEECDTQFKHRNIPLCSRPKSIKNDLLLVVILNAVQVL